MTQGGFDKYEISPRVLSFYDVSSDLSDLSAKNSYYGLKSRLRNFPKKKHLMRLALQESGMKYSDKESKTTQKRYIDSVRT